MNDEHTSENDQAEVEYEIHFNRGNGWQGLDEAIQGASPVATLDEALHNLDRLAAIKTTDAYYDGAETRIVRVERRVIPPGEEITND